MELPHVWYFADGDLPPVDDGHPFTAHEALVVLDPTETDAELALDLYWEDRPPTLGISLAVAAERVRCFRLETAHPAYTLMSSSGYHAGLERGHRG